MTALSRGLLPYVLLLVLSAVFFVPGMVEVPPLDRDEPRFAQATRQMLETGDFVDIRFQDDPRHKKPIGIYWMQAASVAATTGPEARTLWPWRLVSAIGATLAVLATFAVGARLAGRPAGLIAGAVMASSILLTVEAHIAKTDAVLLACIVLAQAALASFYLPWARSRAAGDATEPPAGGRAARLVLWLSLGVGILVKGPIAPMVVGLTILALVLLHLRVGWLGRLGWRWGVPLMLAVAAPWLVAITLATDGAFLRESVGGDLWAKILTAQESHGAPPGTYAGLALITLWPGSLVLVPALIAALTRWQEPLVKFCVAWIVPTWIVMELVATKLVHYVLPVYPALAVLIGALVAGPLAGRAAGPIRWMWLWYGPWAVVGLGLAVGLVAVPFVFGDGFLAWSLLAGLGAAGGTLGALWLVRHGRWARALAVAIAGAALCYGTTFARVMPALDQLWLSRSLADAVTALGETAAPVASAGFSEPSLVFYLGTDTVLTDGAGAADHLAAHANALALVEASRQAAFADAAAAQGLTVEAAGTVDGFNYSRGDWLSLTLYRRVAGSSPP